MLWLSRILTFSGGWHLWVSLSCYAAHSPEYGTPRLLAAMALIILGIWGRVRHEY